MSKHSRFSRRVVSSVSGFLLALTVTSPSAFAVGERPLPPPGFPSYTFANIEFAGAAPTILYALNDSGLGGGDYPVGNTQHAILYRHGAFEPLDPEGSFGQGFSAVGGIDDEGDIVGAYSDASGFQHGFLLRKDRLSTVDYAGHQNSNGVGINSAGAIIGWYWDADGALHGFFRDHGVDTPLNFPGATNTLPLSINSKGEVVGQYGDFPKLQSFYRSADGRLEQLDFPCAPSDSSPYVAAINDRGEVLAYYVEASGNKHGFIMRRGTCQILDFPGAVSTITYAINNRGQFTGVYRDAAGKQHGYLATPER